MQEMLGVEGFVKAYRKNLQKALENESLAVTVESSRIQKAATKDVLRHRRAIPQKQAGLYAVFYQPVGGVIAPQKLVQLYEAIRDMQDVEIRLTPEEGLYLINCSSVEAQKLLAMTEDGANTLFETSVACIGSSICQVGVRDSQEVLRACVEAVRREDFADGVLPQIHISGCPSSCSAHQIGTIGFRGAVKQSPEGPKPACAIFIDGCAQQGSESIAEAGPSILVEDIPRFLVELGRGVAAENSTYAQWAKAHPEKLAQLIQKYA
jgi:ferredoxin-nitrite reductase